MRKLSSTFILCSSTPSETRARNGPTFRASLLIDYQRASRLERGASSRTAIAPLLARSPQCAEAYLWRTPALVDADLLPRLRRAVLTVIPQRARELLGLLHMKLFLFDDTLIISGYSYSYSYVLQFCAYYRLQYEYSTREFFNCEYYMGFFIV